MADGTAHSAFLGLTPEWWTAVATVGLVFATVILALVGLGQVRDIRHQNKQWQTLSACERYYLDPLLDKALRALKSARDDGTFDRDPKAFKIDVTTVLNYLDGIAIGVFQGLYIEGLARDHLEHMVNDHVRDYLTDGIPGRVGIAESDYRCLLKLWRQWQEPEAPQTHFQAPGR